MNASTFRKIARLIHFGMAALIGTFIYSPWSSNPSFVALIMWVALPVLTLTGLCMWKQGPIMKLLKNKAVVSTQN